MLKMTKRGRIEGGGQLPVLSLLMAAIVAMAPCAFADEAAATAAGVDLEVAYCESTGEQYIDTGILGNPGLKVEADIMWMNVTSEDQHILGSYDKIGNDARRCYPLSTVGNLVTMFHFGTVMDFGWFTYQAGGRYRVEASFGASAQSLVIRGIDDAVIYSNSDNKTYTSVASGQTLYLFAAGNSVEATGYAHMTRARVYRMKIYQNDTLVRDYRPARRGDEYGLWEDVGGTFCGSATEIPFKSDVPSSVDPVDGKPDFLAQWIQSTGSTFIDTGVIARPETKIEAKYQFKVVTMGRLIGARVGDSKYFAITCHNGARMQFVSAGTAVYLDGTYIADTDYTAVMDVHADSQTYTVTGPSGTSTTNDNRTASDLSPYPLYVFGMSYNGVKVDGACKARLYYMKIWQNGNLVRDFVPGIKGGEGCLYDRVNDKCYFSGATNGVITSAAGLVGPPLGTPRYPKYRLSYLGSEGNSYLDTGVLGNPGLKIAGEIAWMGAVPGDASNIDWHILGSFDKTLNRRCYAVSAVSSRKPFFGVGAAATQIVFYYDLERKYKIEATFGETAQTLKIDDVNSFTVNGTFNQISTGQTLYLFALGHSANGVSSRTRGRVYSLKIWQDGALVHDYIPVIADNGGPYFYDKATQTFNQGATSGFWDVGEVTGRVPMGFNISIR